MCFGVEEGKVFVGSGCLHFEITLYNGLIHVVLQQVG